MEGPTQFTVMDIERSHIARHAWAVAFLDMIADDDEVLIHHRRRRHAGVPSLNAIADLSSVEIYNSVDPEFGVQRASFCVQRQKPAARGSDYDLGTSGLVAG